MNRKSLLLTIVLLAGCGGEPEQRDPSAIEQAGKDLGQAAAADLKEEIDQAKAVEQQMQQAAENLDQQIDEQSADHPTDASTESTELTTEP